MFVRPPIESGNYSLISLRDNVEQFKKRIGITLTGLLLAYVSWWVRGLVNGFKEGIPGGLWGRR